MYRLLTIGRIVQPQNAAKNRIPEISTSGIAMGNVVSFHSRLSP